MAKITGHRKTSAAAVNWRAARYFLELAQGSKEAQIYTCAAAMIFAAFTHEAFLNSLGPKVIEDWDKRDRMSVGAKLQEILRATGHNPDLGKRPYQCLPDIFRLRNRLAHGREAVVHEDGVKVDGDSPLDYFDALAPDWEKYCTVANGEAAIEDVKSIAIDLNQAAGIKEFAGYPFGSIGSGSYKIE